jgi:hypothetical protein
VGSLGGYDKELGDILLLGGEELEEVGVESETRKLVETDETGLKLEDGDFLVEVEFRVTAEVLGEELVGETLGVTEKVEGGEVERVRLVLVGAFLVGVSGGKRKEGWRGYAPASKWTVPFRSSCAW